ncbi:hypothetical protein D8X75_18535, partial [Vibrio cholerae]|nr:hypothetical protein [Vibrio cholerae]EGR1429622.1 hypothetical protein [Vibrio cholerae]
KYLGVLMRTFSKEEKAILSKLVKSKTLRDEGMILLDLFLENEFFGHNSNKSILADPTAGKTYVSVDSLDKEVCRNGLIETVTLIQLLTELEENGYVSFVGSTNSNKIAIGNQHSNGTTVELPSSLSQFVNTTLGNFILPSASLKELVDNKFKSEDQRRHCQAMWVASIALITSIAFGVWGIVKDLFA